MAPTRASTSVACDVCGKTISRKADLPRHMRTHAANKEALMHECPYDGCEYKSLQRSNVETHLNTHTGRRPNKCPTPGCGYSTSDPGSLTRHRKTMHGYEPKANTVVRPSNAARKVARRQRRTAPYPTASSNSSGSSSASSRAPSSDCSSDVFDCTFSETSSTPASSSSSPHPSPSDVKNTSPAYSTALIPELPEPSSQLDPLREAQWMVEYLRSQFSSPACSTASSLEEQPTNYYVNDASPSSSPSPSSYTYPVVPVAPSPMDLPTSAPLSDDHSNALLDAFLDQFADCPSPAYFPPPSPLPYPLIPTQPVMSMDDTLYAFPYSYPSDLNSNVNALMYDSQWCEPSYIAPLEDFSAPVDWSYFENALYGADTFFSNEVLAY